VLCLLLLPKIAAARRHVAGLFSEQEQIEGGPEPSVSEQVAHFFGLHALQSWLKVPNISHGQ
jgi:hypothetical protein